MPPFEVPWGVLDGLWAWILSVAGVTLVGALLGELIRADTLTQDAATAWLLPATSIATLGAVLLVVSRRHPGSVWRLRGPVRPTAGAVAVGFAWGIVGYVCVGLGVAAGLSALVEATGGEVPEVQPTFRMLAGMREYSWLLVVSVVGLTPIAEELLFRGVIFQGVRTRAGTWPGITASALLFGAVHLSPNVELGGNLLVFVITASLGVVFAWAFDRSGSVVVPIVAHALYNGVGVSLLLAS